MFESVPKNQHYVWRHHLEAWAVGGKVACRRHSSADTFATNPKNIANERYFYQVAELTDGELDYLRQIADAGRTEEAREVNRNFLAMFSTTTYLRRLIASAARDDDARAQSEALLLQAERGLGESWHGAIEDKGLPYLVRLRAGDASFWQSEEEASDFCMFLGTQYMRTARMRNAVHASVLPAGLDLTRVWPVESHFWATEIGAAFYRHRHRTRATIAINDTAIPFVTGDQPVINLKPQQDLEPVFYYPVSPRIALMLGIEDSDCPVVTRSLGVIEVERLNYDIYRWSDDQIYGTDTNQLTGLGSLPKALDL